MSKYVKTKDSVRYYEEEEGYTDILVEVNEHAEIVTIKGKEYYTVRVYNNKVT